MGTQAGTQAGAQLERRACMLGAQRERKEWQNRPERRERVFPELLSTGPRTHYVHRRPSLPGLCARGVERLELLVAVILFYRP